MERKCTSNQRGVAGCKSLLSPYWAESILRWLTYFSGITLLTGPFAEITARIGQNLPVLIAGIPNYWTARGQLGKDLGSPWKIGFSRRQTS